MLRLKIQLVLLLNLPGLPRPPRAPLFADRALAELWLPEPWAAAAAAANVAKFCS